jgi:hypothetical protein
VKAYVVALLVVVGVLGGFYGGYRVGQNNVSASTNTSSGQFARTGNGGAGAVCPSPGAPSPSPGTQAVARGSVTDLASGSMTVSNTTCDVKVTFGATVNIQKQTAGSTGDLQDNETVTITGTRQADGSIKATTILIGGIAFRVGGGGAGPGG